ncbi:MAG: hypothetical protein IPJ85_03145 [Flavobacteriales bacterium]|nr:hypothetical protein [Flavobacteriales bacterium]
MQAVWALDANTWKVVGKDGTCLSSTDGGFNWNPLSVPASTDLNDITFLSSQIGLICGDEGLIMRSTDGGGVWSAVASGTGNELNALWSVSATEVYACGAGGTVLKTMDSGLTWMPMTTPTTAVLRDIVVSSGSGFAVGTLGTIIRLSPSTMGLNESDIALGVSLSPVPTNEEVTLTVIDARLKNALTAEVIDGKGAVVMGTGLIGDTARFAGLPTGSYVLRLNRDGVAVHTRRFVVAR